jgi:hypothetical protein
MPLHNMLLLLLLLLPSLQASLARLVASLSPCLRTAPHATSTPTRSWATSSRQSSTLHARRASRRRPMQAHSSELQLRCAPQGVMLCVKEMLHLPSAADWCAARHSVRLLRQCVVLNARHAQVLECAGARSLHTLREFIPMVTGSLTHVLAAAGCACRAE